MLLYFWSNKWHLWHYYNYNSIVKKNSYIHHNYNDNAKEKQCCYFVFFPADERSKHWQPIINHSALKSSSILKRGHMTLLKSTLFCVFGVMQCLHGLRFKIQIIFHITYIIVALFCPAFLKHIHFYKAHRFEKRGVLWLASYPVHCDWSNTSSVWRMLMLHPLPYLEYQLPWRWRQQYYSENKSYTFFVCVYIWAVLCKSSHTVT